VPTSYRGHKQNIGLHLGTYWYCWPNLYNLRYKQASNGIAPRKNTAISFKISSNNNSWGWNWDYNVTSKSVILSSSSSMAQQPILSQDLLQKLPPALLIPCRGRRILDSPAIAFLAFSTVLFSGAGCQPCVQPPAILEDRRDCFLVWVFITDQPGTGGPASSYPTASIAPWLIRPHKPHHQPQGHANPRWSCNFIHDTLWKEQRKINMKCSKALRTVVLTFNTHQPKKKKNADEEYYGYSSTEISVKWILYFVDRASRRNSG
jgi:hypothetical protein